MTQAEQTPAVSVLVPVYNAGKHLRRCLDSLAAQTFRDFEVVALDDGSTDDSLATLREFAAEHPFLRVATQPNAGCATTRNRLVKMARGEFVMFMDNDDTVAPDYIERYVAEARRTGADIVHGGYRRAAIDGRTLYTVRARDTVWSPFVTITAWAKMFRRDFLIDSHAEFFAYGLGEDIPFYLAAHAGARREAAFDYVGYSWTDNSTSVSNTAHRRFAAHLDPVVLLDKCVSAIGATSDLARLFYVRFAIWYLLYAGRNAAPDEFIRQCERLFGWMRSNGVPVRYPFHWFFVEAGDLKAFLVARAFLAIRRLGLLRLFARVYCRGTHGRMVRLLVPPQSGDGLARDTFWSAISSSAAAGMSFIILMLAARFAGAYWCGIAAMGLAMSQQVFPLGNFMMENYQASDIAERRSFADYVSAKTVSIAAMIAVSAAWIALDWRGVDRTMAFLAMLLYQTSEAFSYAFFSRYQQKGRLDTACRVRFFKIVAFVAVFALFIAVGRNPVVAMAAASLAHVAMFAVLDVPLLRVFGPLRMRFPRREALLILLACAPLAVNSLLVMSVHNGPRFAVDSELGAEALAAYSALFMVSFAVAMCAEFLMNPQVVRLAAALRDGDRRAALRTIKLPLAAILGVGVLGLAAACSVGIPVLSFLFRIDLSGNVMTLCLLLCGGIFLSLYQLAQTILVVLRRHAWGLPGMVVASSLVLLSSRRMVEAIGMSGAAAVYLVAVAVLALCSGSFAVAFLRRALAKARRDEGSSPPSPSRNEDHTFAVCAYGDSPYVEECICSLERQTVASRIVIATHTPSPFLEDLARRHGVELFVNKGPGGITQDWNFALSVVKTRFATIAHQDDTYEPEYARRVLAAMRESKRPLVAFTDYGELRGGERVFDNRLLRIKRAMLLPMRPRALASCRWARRLSLAFGDAICCPSVTFCLDNVERPIFQDGFRSCEDWQAWERISRQKGQFLYVPKPLMMHRIHAESETSKIIGDGARVAENLAMFLKFWPRPIALALNRFYTAAEDSNEVNSTRQ